MIILVGYVIEDENINFVHKLFNKIKVENNIFLIPYDEDIKKHREKKILDKLYRELQKYNVNRIVLSNKLISSYSFINQLKEYGIRIFDGKLLYKIILPQIVETVCGNKKSNIENEKVAMLINSNDEIDSKNIELLAQKVKSLNIVTNYPSRFINMSNYLFEEMGIIVKVSTGRKITDNIVINIDFNETKINEYRINPKAIIINCICPTEILSKQFEGINIYSYNIIVPDEYKIDRFNQTFIYESNIYSRQIKEIEEKIRNDNIKIKELIGQNGVINKEEFLAL